MFIAMENDWLKVEIETNGAEVRKVKHKKNGLDYMWTGDNAYWGRVSPILFPIVGRLKEDRYRHDGKAYEMPQHGFLRDVMFDLVEQTKTKVSFVVESAGRFSQIYPFEFKVYIRYMLEEDSLIVRWEVVNENKEIMYFSIGAHPAFRVPLLENETIEDYNLHIDSAMNRDVMKYELKNSLIHKKGNVNNILAKSLSHSLFKNDALIYSNVDFIQLVSKKSGHGVEVMFTDFPFVGIWSKYVDSEGTMAPFVCIEPWYGIADTDNTDGEIKNKFGINKLGIGETFQSEYSMKFK